MGYTVTLDEEICYLVSNNDDQVFAFRRKFLDPKLTSLCMKIYDRRTLDGGDNVNYMVQPPWGGYLKRSTKENIQIEEQFRKLIADSAKHYPQLSSISRSDFENSKSLWHDPSTFYDSSESRLHRATSLLKLIEAFCWVSKAFEVESYFVGDTDIDFRISRKSALSFLGKKGSPELIFRWSEFVAVDFTGVSRFSIKTKHSVWACDLKR